MSHARCHSIYCILPPHVMEHLTQSADAKIRRAAIAALASDAQARTLRSTLAMLPVMAAIPSPQSTKHRLVYDLQQKASWQLPGKLVRSEGQGKISDPAVDEAYDGSGKVYDFYSKILGRNSLDDKGMSLISSVHVGKSYNNAFWNGEQMAYGDGDNKLFQRFTKSLDVIGHELTHGVITHTANLDYVNQSGALNEHFADVFGVLVKQWKKKQTAKKADWMIGREIMGPGVKARCLRIMTADKAYENDAVLGTDPQPKHMDGFYSGQEDNGGVHINSGIPNFVFYQVAQALGGYAWEKAGKIWYQTLLRLNRTSNFSECAKATVESAERLYAGDSSVAKTVRVAWKNVGVTV